MTDEPKALLDRIEEKAREALPLWQCLFFVGLVGLPILLGFGYAALAERAVWRLHSEEYQIILWIQGGATMALFIAGVMDMSKGWTRKLFRQPDPRNLSPGPFRLGFGFVEVYYRPWWGVPVMGVGMNFLFRLMDDDDPAISVHGIFWDSREMFGGFFAAVLAVIGIVFLIGLGVQHRLGQRDSRA